MNSLQLTFIWVDDDGMLQLGIGVSSPSHSLYHETYVYPDQLVAFAEGLKAFPINTEAEVTFECGSKDPKFHDYIRIRAFVLNPNGHSALEIESEVRGAAPVRAESHFFVAGLPADFNNLGKKIATWLAALRLRRTAKSLGLKHYEERDRTITGFSDTCDCD